MKERVRMPLKELSPAPSTTPGHPPCVIFHGTADDTITFATAEEFTELMKQAGNDYTLHPFEGKDHECFIVVEGKMETKIITKH